MKRIFIGGTGRSGTSILLHALYCHGDIFAVPVETKFLVEEDGFDDLITALTTRFTPTGAATAVARFRDLMFDHVTGRVDSKFLMQEHVPGEVFLDYQQALDDFMYGLNGSGRYFPDRTLPLDLTRRFIAALFDAETTRSDKSVWAEKTPSNFWRLGFLRELFPACYFVHAIRDPRAVFLSLLERRWLPEDVDEALTVFTTHIDALLRLRRVYRDRPRFIEVRLEDLVLDHAGTLDRLATALGLRPFDEDAAASVAASMDTYYAGRKQLGVTLTEQQRESIGELLLPAVTELGYPLEWRPR
jgi:hypothetical protein